MNSRVRPTVRDIRSVRLDVEGRNVHWQFSESAVHPSYITAPIIPKPREKPSISFLVSPVRLSVWCKRVQLLGGKRVSAPSLATGAHSHKTFALELYLKARQRSSFRASLNRQTHRSQWIRKRGMKLKKERGRENLIDNISDAPKWDPHSMSVVGEALNGNKIQAKSKLVHCGNVQWRKIKWAPQLLWEWLLTNYQIWRSLVNNFNAQMITQ